MSVSSFIGMNSLFFGPFLLFLMILSGFFFGIFLIAHTIINHPFTFTEVNILSSKFGRQRQNLLSRQNRLSTTTTSSSEKEALEESVREILLLLFRDYIYSWHVPLSHIDEFPKALLSSVSLCLQALSERIRFVDWIPFLTTRLVDDVATHVRLFKHAKKLKQDLSSNESESKTESLESYFFDAEVAMEVKFCRDSVSTVPQEENSYLQDIVELCLFLLLPTNDFRSSTLRLLTRELIVNVALKPVLNLMSDPDFINQNLIRFCDEYPVKPEDFSLTLRTSENYEELRSTKEMLNQKINFLRSQDSKGELDSSLRQQLSSLVYLRKSIDNRIQSLTSGSKNSDYGGQGEQKGEINKRPVSLSHVPLFDLPIEVILKNNIALSYFIDYMSSIGSQSYLFYYLNVEGWKVSAEQRLQEIMLRNLQESSDSNYNHESLKNDIIESAHSIYEEYLSEKAGNNRLKIDDSLIKKLLFRIRTQDPDPDWFDESQQAVFDKLVSNDKFLNSFKKSIGYSKLLAELDLLTPKVEEEEDLFDEDFSLYDSSSLNSYRGEEEFNETGYQSLSSAEQASFETKSENLHIAPRSQTHKRIGSEGLISRHSSQSSSLSKTDDQIEKSKKENSYFSAEILSFSSVRDSHKTYTLYTILVKSKKGYSLDGKEEEDVRQVLRRYSDFYYFHEKVLECFPSLDKLKFPSKKTFGNLERNLLEKRQKMLNDYIHELIQLEKEIPKLMPMLRKFLEDGMYEKEERSLNVTKVLVNPLRNSVKTVSRTVSSVPSQLFNTVDNVMDGISKAVFQTHKPLLSSSEYFKVSASIDADSTDNIPLRIILLLLDEIFDLQERNQWLRRQIITVVRQIIKGMFGDIVNRRIVEYFAQYTSISSITSYLKTFKETFWPSGIPAEISPPRTLETKYRTRIAARASLYSSMNDDLRRVIGSETSRNGLSILFECLQYPSLNKRLLLVLLEGVLSCLFESTELPNLLIKLHSRSPRLRNELKNSSRAIFDVRRTSL